MVRVGREIELISARSFEWSRAISVVDFAADSRLVCIGGKAFAHCDAISSISLPPSTEILCRSCFRHCHCLEAVSFDAGSKLRRIESEAFRGCGGLTRLSVPMCVKGNDGLDLSGVDDVEIAWV
jgi:hypothetical protein